MYTMPQKGATELWRERHQIKFLTPLESEPSSQQNFQQITEYYFGFSKFLSFVHLYTAWPK